VYGLTYHATHVRRLPAPARHCLVRLVRLVLGPLGAWWLRDRFTAGRMQVTDGRRVVRARVEDGRPVLILSGGQGAERELSADHVMAATGYRMDVAALGFLGHELRTELSVSRGRRGWTRGTGLRCRGWRGRWRLAEGAGSFADGRA
jgi:hypothetical protein